MENNDKIAEPSAKGSDKLINAYTTDYIQLSDKSAEEILQKTLTPEEKVIEEMNKKYAIIHTNSTYVLIEKEENAFVLDSFNSLRNLHANDFFKDSEGKTKNKAAFWLKHANRRSYKNLIFDPIRPGHYEGNYNIFSGFAIKPQQGNCSLYWEHVKNIICNGNESYFSYVKKWMAAVIQKPNLLATALVLRGLQGTGKNKFVEYFGKIFGNYFLTINSLKHIVGRFNSHLQYAYLVLANEAIWGGDKREIGALKAIITDPWIFIEPKGKDGFQIKNCRHLIVCSNEDWAVPMDLDDRRFFVLDVSSKHKEDIQYFKALHNQMSNGGVEALLYDLLNEDLNNFDPRIMPLNDSGFDIKIKSSSSSERYIYEALKAGSWELSYGVPVGAFGDKACQTLQNHYRGWCDDEGLKKQCSAEFGKTLNKLIPSVKKVRPTIEGARIWTYCFLPLEKCRLEFQRFTKQTDKIWEDVQDDFI